ncbi:MAG TPA: hypothetical protein VH062_26570 [Polyangiaceae bacterium]|nr:hypothetical protein [Polyangiaceae bacterium]
MVAAGVARVEQRTRSDGRDITLVDWSRLCRPVRPSHDVTAPDLRSPPVQGVSSEYPRPQNRHVECGSSEQSLDASMDGPQRIWLPEERMRRLVRRRQVDDVPSLLRQPRDERRSGVHRGSPDEENAFHAVEGRTERRRNGEIAHHDLDAGGKRRVFRAASESAHRHPGAQQLIDDETPDAACRARHEDRTRTRAPHELHPAQRTIGEFRRLRRYTRGQGFSDRH